jgi:hypothetical protein
MFRNLKFRLRGLAWEDLLKVGAQVQTEVSLRLARPNPAQLGLSVKRRLPGYLEAKFLQKRISKLLKPGQTWREAIDLGLFPDLFKRFFTLRAKFLPHSAKLGGTVLAMLGVQAKPGFSSSSPSNLEEGKTSQRVKPLVRFQSLVRRIILIRRLGTTSQREVKVLETKSEAFVALEGGDGSMLAQSPEARLAGRARPLIQSNSGLQGGPNSLPRLGLGVVTIGVGPHNPTELKARHPGNGDRELFTGGSPQTYESFIRGLVPLRGMNLLVFKTSTGTRTVYRCTQLTRRVEFETRRLQLIYNSYCYRLEVKEAQYIRLIQLCWTSLVPQSLRGLGPCMGKPIRLPHKQAPFCHRRVELPSLRISDSELYREIDYLKDYQSPRLPGVYAIPYGIPERQVVDNPVLPKALWKIVEDYLLDNLAGGLEEDFSKFIEASSGELEYSLTQG